ncbi:MAG: type II toxin-antitoxin system Phd/YefM family antitoxin [Alkalispirochaeta sp.]
MKTVDVRNLQHHLGSFLDAVERGETLEVRRRKKVIARIEPVSGAVPPEWPDLLDRVNALYPDGACTPSASDVLYGDRD